MQKEVNELEKLLTNALLKLKGKKIVLLFSGGLDSTVLAALMKKLKIRFSCVTAGAPKSQDIGFAKLAAKEVGVKTRIIKLNMISAKRTAAKAVKLLGPNPVYVSIAIPVIAALEKTSGKNIIITGLGSDEIFAGYQSHQDALKRGYPAVQKECRRRMKTVKKDIKRDKKLAKTYKQEIYFPFLDKKLIKFGLKLDPRLKISETERKRILRKLAEKLGIPGFLAKRPKKAIQYGSGANELLKKVAKKEGFKNISEFLNYTHEKHF